LLAGHRSDGEPTFEVVPARLLLDGFWRLLGTPALAEGCAEGDLLAVDEQGAFEVRQRGGNVSVVSYAQRGETNEPHLSALRHLLAPLQGKVECAPDGRWVVATVPVSVGFPAIEGAMKDWSAKSGRGWSFGNVYNENDEPLNWW